MWQTDSTWVVGALRSAQRLAAEDAETRARLAAALRRQQAASVDDRGERRCRECHQQMKHTAPGDLCKRCSRVDSDVTKARAKLKARGIHL